MCTLGIIIDSKVCFEKNNVGVAAEDFGPLNLLLNIHKVHMIGKKCINILVIIQNF